MKLVTRYFKFGDEVLSCDLKLRAEFEVENSSETKLMIEAKIADTKATNWCPQIKKLKDFLLPRPSSVKA